MEQRMTGIVLAKKDIGEADRLYTFYTPEKGKIQAVAKGVRKSQARLAGSLENFNLVSFTVVGKGGTKKITQALVEENFSSIRGDLEKMEQAFKKIMIFDRLVEKGERDVKLYNYLLDLLLAVNGLEMNHRDKLELIGQGFLLKILSQLGYKFEITRCVACGNNLRAGNNCFNFEAGGVLCRNCAKADPSGMKISDNTIKAVRIIYQNQLKSLSKLQAGNNEISELGAMTAGYLRWIAK